MQQQQALRVSATLASPSYEQIHGCEPSHMLLGIRPQVIDRHHINRCWQIRCWQISDWPSFSSIVKHHLVLSNLWLNHHEAFSSVIMPNYALSFIIKEYTSQDSPSSTVLKPHSGQFIVHPFFAALISSWGCLLAAQSQDAFRDPADVW